MDPLKQEIQSTSLFTPQEKIDILATFDTLGEDDKKKLSEIIDSYDAKYKAITGTFKKNMMEELSSIDTDAQQEEKERIRSSTDKIRAGLNTILPD